MTTFTLEFSDTVADLYRTRLAPAKGYKPTIEVDGKETANPQSVDEFIVEKIHEWLCVECTSYERIHRTETAIKSEMDQYQAAIIEATPILKAKSDAEKQRKADEAEAIEAAKAVP